MHQNAASLVESALLHHLREHLSELHTVEHAQRKIDTPLCWGTWHRIPCKPLGTAQGFPGWSAVLCWDSQTNLVALEQACPDKLAAA